MNDPRDPELERAWRAHSRETPPPELDRAILAAAHRAVGSRPQDAAARAQATRPQRWWMPLAAAATIGVVAIGIMQTTPQDQIVAPPSSPVVASAPVDAVKERDENSGQKRVADAVATDKKQSEQNERLGASMIGKLDVAPAPAPPPASAPAPAPTPTPAPARMKATAPAPAPAPEPFPATPALRKSEAAPASDASSSRAIGGYAEGKVMQSTTRADSPSAGVDIPHKDELRNRQQAIPAAAPVEEAALARKNAMAPAPVAPPPPMAQSAPATAGSRLREYGNSRDESRPVAAATPPPLAKNYADADVFKAKAQNPDAWIAQIRRLRDEGRTEEMTRELREFRARVPDAMQRLPADLRSLASALPP